MKCESCGQNEATVLYQEVSMEELRQKALSHICSECAQKYGLSVLKKESSKLSAEEILSGLIQRQKEDKDKDLKCPECDFTYGEFKKSGRVGCGNCYSAFSSQLEKLIDNIQRAVKHKGKIPQKPKESSGLSSRSDELLYSQIEQHILRLQDQLKEAVETQEFEKAALLRDTIAELKKEK